MAREAVESILKRFNDRKYKLSRKVITGKIIIGESVKNMKQDDGEHVEEMKIRVKKVLRETAFNHKVFERIYVTTEVMYHDIL